MTDLSGRGSKPIRDPEQRLTWLAAISDLPMFHLHVCPFKAVIMGFVVSQNFTHDSQDTWVFIFPRVAQ